MEAEECVSAKNNPQIKITLDVFDDANGENKRYGITLANPRCGRSSSF